MLTNISPEYQNSAITILFLSNAPLILPPSFANKLLGTTLPVMLPFLFKISPLLLPLWVKIPRARPTANYKGINGETCYLFILDHATTELEGSLCISKGAPINWLHNTKVASFITTPASVKCFDLLVTNIKIAFHARFDEGMNDLPAATIPPYFQYLQHIHDGLFNMVPLHFCQNVKYCSLIH
jgi:hypothetical protein